jgi:hypothetical protein
MDGVRSLPSGSCGRRRWWCRRLRRRCGWVVTVERCNRLIRTNMGHASAGIAKFFGFEFSSSVEVAFPMPCKSVESRPGSLVPGVERIGIGLPQLFLCGQAIRKLFKSYVRGDRSHAPDQNNQHPFHNSVPRSSKPTGQQRSNAVAGSRLANIADGVIFRSRALRQACPFDPDRLSRHPRADIVRPPGRSSRCQIQS